MGPFVACTTIDASLSVSHVILNRFLTCANDSMLAKDLGLNQTVSKFLTSATYLVIMLPPFDMVFRPFPGHSLTLVTNLRFMKMLTVEQVSNRIQFGLIVTDFSLFK